MKITKEMLSQLIREEMSATDMDRAFAANQAADAEVIKRAVVRGPDGEEVSLERTADMSNEEWENAKRVAMGGRPKRKLSYADKLRKKQDAQVAVHRANKKKQASMFAKSKGGTPQLEQIIREEIENILNEEKAYYEMLSEGETIEEAKYRGRKVKLNKPMRGDVKKSKVYVKNAKGNVVKVNFGDKKMKIKKSNPKRRKSFRARHKCKTPGPKWKARYWSCKAW